MNSTDERLRDLAPIGAEEVRGLALDGEGDLCRAITATRRRRNPLHRLFPASAPGGRVPLAAVVASVALLALALGGLTAVLAGSAGSGPTGGPAGAPAGQPAGAETVQGTVVTGPADAADARANMRPVATTPSTTPSAATTPAGAPDQRDGSDPMAGVVRYLPSEPGWKVTRVDEYGGDGEMTIAKGRLQFELSWRTGSFSDWVKDREDGADHLPAVQLDGRPVTVLRSRDARNWFIALWQAGGRTMEFRPVGIPGGPPLPDRAGFTALVQSLRPASASSWQAALPAGVVLPDRYEGVARTMLEDVPLPEGFDLKEAAKTPVVKDRYQFGAQMVGAVACAWIDQWAAARRAGDRAAATAAADAMATSRRWAVLHEMDRDGDYPEVLWEFAAALKRRDGRTFDGKGQRADRAAVEGLGCGSR